MEYIPSPDPQNQPPSKRGFLGKVLVGLIIAVVFFSIGWDAGHDGLVFVPSSFKIVNENKSPANVDYSLLWDAINTINQKYIDQPIDQQKVLYGAVSGAVASLGDPYTEFFAPTDLQNFETGLAGTFGGIGAEVGEKNGNVVIIAPIAGTPAQKAGLLPGDIISAVNASTTQNLTVDQVVDEIRGPKGTNVTLTIVRGTEKPFNLSLTRDNIVIKSVTWTYKDITTAAGKKETIALVTISEFGDDTSGLFTQAAADIKTHNVSGIVIDLRNNPGGYLQSAVDVASYWVKPGDIVVSEAHSDGTTIKYTGEGNNKLAGIKTEVLINSGTASAAEILSGALHDHGFAQLIGEKSFGKGSVQELVNLPGGSAIKVTVAKWITPDGVNLNHNGLNPDIPVTLTPDDVTSGKDPQMDAAIAQFSK